MDFTDNEIMYLKQLLYTDFNRMRLALDHADSHGSHAFVPIGHVECRAIIEMLEETY
jgi:hypothetical protein